MTRKTSKACKGIDNNAMPISKSKECPKCGLVNPGSAMRCDCGYNFEGHATDIVSKVNDSDRNTFNKRTGTFSYIGKHWRGELPLVQSFWLNVILVNICMRMLEAWLTSASPTENPVIASKVTIVYVFLGLAIVYPWQIIGLWRSANKHLEITKKGFWVGAVKVLVVFGLLGTLADLASTWQVYRDIYQLGFGKDKYGDFQVELTNDNAIIHLKGGLGFGISKDVERLITKNPDINGIILDSIGGNIYEGRELSKIILIHRLDTYTLVGCYSACGTAFISGNKRYLGKGANLAFHKYQANAKSFEPYLDMPSEQKNDLLIYRRANISKEFIDRIFQAESDDLWYPTIDEMLNAGVIHGVVNPSDLGLIRHRYDSLDTSDIENLLEDVPSFQTIRKYDPDAYRNIVEDVGVLAKEGASGIEIQQAVGSYIAPLANKSLPRTSDKAVIMFTSEMIQIMKMLEKMDPILCVKYLFPDQYGALEMAKYFTTEEMTSLLNALSSVITDSYETEYTPIDVQAAEELVTNIVLLLGDSVQYLDGQGLKNREDYSNACKTFVKTYELIMENDTLIAGNGLRYMFSP